MSRTTADWELQSEATSLCGRYAQALDDHDWTALSNVFTSDAVMTFAHIGPVDGIAAIGETCAAALQHLDASQHLVGSVVVDTAGENATCRSYFQAQHVKGEYQLLVGGSYEDTLTLTESGWRITHRVQSVTWTNGDSRALDVAL